jgi:dTDP-glucose 4,6-dehydratase
MRYLVTGGAGFIGSALCRKLIKNKTNHVLCIDNLSYSSNLNSILEIKKNKNFKFKNIDICNNSLIYNKLIEFKPDGIFNLAAHTHVDRSIDSPKEFIVNNVNGVFSLLEAVRKYYVNYLQKKKKKFKLIHISTDEVYGSLKFNQRSSLENDQYKPSSPYSASKAASDHLALSWHLTYDLPIIVSNCCNNYGEWQFPEKLIPRVIYKALKNQSIEVYGNGKNIREWIHVNDHAKSLILLMNKGFVGEAYNVGSGNQISNIKLVKKICLCLNKLLNNNRDYSKLIKLVSDRPAHDLKYSLNYDKIKLIGFECDIDFEYGLESTVKWYLKNKEFLFNKELFYNKRIGIGK